MAKSHYSADSARKFDLHPLLLNVAGAFGPPGGVDPRIGCGLPRRAAAVTVIRS